MGEVGSEIIIVLPVQYLIGNATISQLFWELLEINTGNYQNGIAGRRKQLELVLLTCEINLCAPVHYLYRYDQHNAWYQYNQFVNVVFEISEQSILVTPPPPSSSCYSADCSKGTWGGDSTTCDMGWSLQTGIGTVELKWFFGFPEFLSL